MDKKLPSGGNLRGRAEEFLLKTRQDIKEMGIEDTQDLVHELQVHQIELQMQIDELQSVQRELELAHEKYRDLFNRAPVGYITMDSEKKIIEANLVSAQLLGRPTIELCGRKFSSFVTPGSQDAYYLHYRSAILTGIQRSCEVQLISRKPLYVQLNTLVIDGGGSCRTSISDVTALKMLEEELFQLRRKSGCIV